jgi:hypothetical protein
MYRPPIKAILMIVWGPSFTSIIMAKKRLPTKAIVREVWGPSFRSNKMAN